MALYPTVPAPHNNRGRPRADDRRTLDAILYVLRTGIAWRDLPGDLGSPITAWRGLKHWQALDIWELLWRTALNVLESKGAVDWSQAQLDGSFVPAKRGGAAVGLTRKGKGTKWMLVTDARGTPIGYHPDSAGLAETRLAYKTLGTIGVRTISGRVKNRPACLVADRGYDNRPFRHFLRVRGIRACIPEKRRPEGWKPRRERPTTYSKADYAQRWRIERTFAWLGYQRRLLIRWERHVDVYVAFFTVGVLMLVLRRLLHPVA
ncbi:IS5 family transposase [Deinococcus peraridilitoris]|uniref:IS5 family transposase n=1 Tax=Deinococcus peraridilitoris TaxID=432329 RepID=UPI000A04757E|nr:IS5 family transposase [Deinococcus peraridilitoris]